MLRARHANSFHGQDALMFRGDRPGIAMLASMLDHLASSPRLDAVGRRHPIPGVNNVSLEVTDSVSRLVLDSACATPFVWQLKWADLGDCGARLGALACEASAQLRIRGERDDLQLVLAVGEDA
ncbi:hypothetical protein [Pseudoxanthomonas sp. GM95]|uniref:hypothetical protein n=1 Tax=Pseudoxanthomonas sp. GM95 TaxID=1881043 RepID=UPI00111462A0|nr:hypothetical protein [Pseudoxanthomonas sp. GM95]